MLSYKNIVYSIGSKTIINDLSVDFKTGELVALCGDNGAGKSTLFNLLYKKLDLVSGSVLIEGYCIKDIPFTEIYSKVSMLTQDPKDSLFGGMTIKEHIRVFSKRELSDSIKRIQKYVNFNVIDKLDSNVDHLSGGQRQTLAFSLLMLKRPKILFLDEHTSALDPSAAESMMLFTKEAVKDHNIVGVMISHDIKLAEKYSDRLLQLAKGRIVYY